MTFGIFHPDPWGDDPISRTYFWYGLKPTRTSHPKKTLEDIVCFVLEICSLNNDLA